MKKGHTDTRGIHNNLTVRLTPQRQDFFITKRPTEEIHSGQRILPALFLIYMFHSLP